MVKQEFKITPLGKEYLDTKQLAERWGISPLTVRNWRVEKRGFHKHVKIFGRAGYLIKDIVEFEKKELS